MFKPSTILLVAAILLSLGFAATAADRPAAAPAVGLFDAIEAGDVTARVYMRDAYHGRVMLRNETAAPLSVALPPVLAAQPVLAQFPFNNNNNNQNNSIFSPNNSSQQSSQTVGSPSTFSTFAIPPESVREIRLNSVCLEHGKPDPKLQIAYELVPFEQVSDNPLLAAVLERYGRGDLDRDVVQAAAWHLANEKSWDDLAAMSKMLAVNARQPIFTARQLQAARKLVGDAERFIAEREAAAVRNVSSSGIAPRL